MLGGRCGQKSGGLFLYVMTPLLFLIIARSPQNAQGGRARFVEFNIDYYHFYLRNNNVVNGMPPNGAPAAIFTGGVDYTENARNIQNSRIIFKNRRRKPVV